jgi:hypothetical protein
MRLLAGVLAGALVVLLAACGGAGTGPGDSQAPILIRGVVVDGTGAPVPTRTVQVTLADHANAKPGQPLTVIYQGQVGLAADGSFEAHVPITPAIADFAARPDHVASFDVVAVGTDGNVVAVFVFSRAIADGAWAGDVPFLTLRSEGASEINEHPAQP